MDAMCADEMKIFVTTEADLEQGVLESRRRRAFCASIMDLPSPSNVMHPRFTTARAEQEIPSSKLSG